MADKVEVDYDGIGLWESKEKRYWIEYYANEYWSRVYLENHLEIRSIENRMIKISW